MLARPSLFTTALAVLLVAASGVSGINPDHRRGRGWRGKLPVVATSTAVQRQSVQRVRGHELVKEGNDVLTTDVSRLPSTSFTEYESESSTTTTVSATVEVPDKEEMMSSEPLNQSSISSEKKQVSDSESKDKEQLQTNSMQIKYTTSRAKTEADMIHDNNDEKNVEKSDTFKAKEDQRENPSQVNMTLDLYNQSTGEDQSIAAISRVSSDNNSVERVLKSGDGGFQSLKNRTEPSNIEREIPKNRNQRPEVNNLTSKYSNTHRNSVRTRPRPRPPSAVANPFMRTSKPQQNTSKHVEIPSSPHGNRGKIPPLGLHPNSPWKRRNNTQASVTSVPRHTTVKNTQNVVSVPANTASVPAMVQEPHTAQNNVSRSTKSTDLVENATLRTVANVEISPQSELQNATLQVVPNGYHTAEKKRVKNVHEAPSIGGSASSIQGVVKSTDSSTRNDRLHVRGKSKGKSAVPKKLKKSDSDDVKPRSSSSAQLIARNSSNASHAVAVVSISLISLITFGTIMGVYFKKISFSRKRYGQHMLLSTEDDDLPLFNRQTNYENYESPYQSWQELR